MVINDEPWFVDKDGASVLGYAKPLNAVAMHVQIEDSLKQGLLDSNGKTQQTIFINESGLYSLILSSKLSQAKEFKHWVTSEVLPQIKKVGGYIPINGCNLVLWFYSSIFFTHTPIRIDNNSQAHQAEASRRTHVKLYHYLPPRGHLVIRSFGQNDFRVVKILHYI